MLDITFVRAQFPGLKMAEAQGAAFFENAGGSFPCQQVIDRLTRFYETRKTQPYWYFEPSKLGGEEMDEARTRLAALMGVAPEEVHFGPSTSQNTYVLSQALRDSFRPGDAIIVTNQDHEANTGVWRRLEAAGFEIREWRMDPDTGHLDPGALANLLDGHVRLVAFPHCSNVIAEINDVHAICGMIRAAGAISCVDGVSYAPHGLPDVGALGPDIYLFSAYKVYGPHQGVMVMRRATNEALPNQGHYFNASKPTARFTPAGPDHAQIAALAGVADYLEEMAAHHGGAGKTKTKQGALAHDLMRAHETRLMQPLLDYLGQKNSVRLLGPAQAEARAPTLAVDIGRPADPVAKALNARGIWLGGDHFYSVRALEGVGVDPNSGVLRMSYVHYTTAAEIDKLIAALDEVL